MASKQLPGPRPVLGPGLALARIAAAVSALCLAPLGAMAQEVLPSPNQGSTNRGDTDPLLSGITIRANVDLVFQPAFQEGVQLLQRTFATGATGANATTEYVFEVLNQAALDGLNQALAQGARSGRVTVVATGCQVGVSGAGVSAAAPVGIFINTTEMDVGEDGVAHFRTRVRFIPDAATAPQADIEAQMQGH